MKLKLWIALILLSASKVLAGQGTITFSNVSVSTDPTKPTHSPTRTVPATATGFTVDVTTDPTWADLTNQDVKLSSGGVGPGHVYIATEIQLSTGGWISIQEQMDNFGETDKSGTPHIIYSTNRPDLGGGTLRIRVNADSKDLIGTPLVVNATAKWDF